MANRPVFIDLLLGEFMIIDIVLAIGRSTCTCMKDVEIATG